jgi:hypothetical protein
MFEDHKRGHRILDHDRRDGHGIDLCPESAVNKYDEERYEDPGFQDSDFKWLQIG